MKNSSPIFFIINRCFLYMCCAGLILTFSVYSETEFIVPAGDWRDTDGKLIAATEGGIIKVGNLYYLWGMDRSANNYGFVGVNLYSSSDLKNWKFVNKILKNTSHADLNNNAVIERAKILHNQKTGKFVMWMHFEGQNAYKTAEVAYATCDSIGGNYTFGTHFRPQNIDSRDINVYQDDDGKAYLICTTEGNQSVTLFELDDNYTGIARKVYQGLASNDMECEGHAIIKSGGYYFWLMSWCTGWDFNDNHYFYAKSLAGPWTSGGNIAVTNTHTYESQVGYAVTVKGSDTTTFLYTGDRWSVQNFGMSRIVLLPIEVKGTSLSVKWQDQWDIDTKTGMWIAGAKNFIDGVYTIKAKHSGMVLGTNGVSVQQQTFTGASNQLWRIQNVGASHFKISSVESGKVMDISEASRIAGAKLLQYAWNDAYNQKWQIIDCGNGYHRLINVNTLGKAIEVEGSSKTTGTDAVLCDFNYKDNQLWQFSAYNKELISGKTYRIVNRASGKVLEASEKTDGVTVTQNSSQSRDGQIWVIEDLYNGNYLLTTYNNQLALDNGSSAQNESLVKAKVVTRRFSQQWQIVAVDGGYYKLVNRYSGKLVDNKDGSLSDGNAIIQYSDYTPENTNQQWKFESADAVNVNDYTARNSRYKNSVDKEPLNRYIYDLRGRIVARCSVSGSWRTGTTAHGVYIVKDMGKVRSTIQRIMVN